MYGEEETRRPVVLQPPDLGDSWGSRSSVNFDIEGSSARNRFREFFRNFRVDNVYIYRDALIRHWNRKELFVEVELAHLNQFDEILFNNLQVTPLLFVVHAIFMLSFCQYISFLADIYANIFPCIDSPQ